MTASLWEMPLGWVADEVGGRQAAPAGVSAASIAATLGIGLLMKAMEIRELRADLRKAAREVSAELRTAADADCAAIRESLASPDAIDIPLGAVRSILRGLAICSEAAPAISGVLAADVIAARELLAGAGRAIVACIEANLAKQPSEEIRIEVASMRARLTA